MAADPHPRSVPEGADARIREIAGLRFGELRTSERAPKLNMVSS